MAYVDEEDKEQQDEQANPEAGGAGPQTASGGAATTPATGAGVAQAGQRGKAPAYQDLGAYIRANAPQTQQMGQKVAQGLTDQFNTTRGAIDTASQGFNQQVSQNTVGLDNNLLNQAASDPNSVAGDASKKSQFQGMLNAQYKGPSSFDSQDFYQGLNNQVEQANQASKVGTDHSYLQNAIATKAKNPTAGQQALDTMLIQQSPEAYNTVRNAAKSLGTLGDYLNQQRTAGNTAAQNAAQTTAATKQAVQDKFLGENGVVNQFNSRLQQNLDNATTNRDQQLADINSVLSRVNAGDKNFTPDEMAALGLDPTAYSGLLSQIGNMQNTSYDIFGKNYGSLANRDFNALKYFSPAEINSAAPTLGDTASLQDYDYESALNDLLGQDIGPLDAANRDKAASYNPVIKQDSYDTTKALQDLNSQYQSNDQRFLAQYGPGSIYGTPLGSGNYAPGELDLFQNILKRGYTANGPKWTDLSAQQQAQTTQDVYNFIMNAKDPTNVFGRPLPNGNDTQEAVLRGYNLSPHVLSAVQRILSQYK